METVVRCLEQFFVGWKLLVGINWWYSNKYILNKNSICWTTEMPYWCPLNFKVRFQKLILIQKIIISEACVSFFRSFKTTFLSHHYYCAILWECSVTIFVSLSGAIEGDRDPILKLSHIFTSSHLANLTGGARQIPIRQRWWQKTQKTEVK